MMVMIVIAIASTINIAAIIAMIMTITIPIVSMTVAILIIIVIISILLLLLLLISLSILLLIVIFLLLTLLTFFVMTVNLRPLSQQGVFFPALLQFLLRYRRLAGNSCWPQLFGCGQALCLGSGCLCLFLMRAGHKAAE